MFMLQLSMVRLNITFTYGGFTMFATTSSFRHMSFGPYVSFCRPVHPVVRSAFASAGGRSSLGAVWFFSPRRGAAAVVLGLARLALAAGHSAVIEPPITVGGAWVVYVS